MNTLLSILTWLSIFLVAYVYVGYPLLIWLISKVRANPVKLDESFTPPVTLIIAAYNEKDVIAEKIKNSLELDYPAEKLQIIIAADGSDDGTPDIARSASNDPRISVLHEPERRGKGHALNRAVEHASGEFYIFSDANAFYQPDTIRKMVRNYADPAVGCVTGKKTVRSDAGGVADSEGVYWKYESFIKRCETRVLSTVGAVGEINSVRASLYKPIPSHIVLDDAFIAMRMMRAGYRVIYEPAAVSVETASLSQRDEIIRRQRNTSGRFQLMFMPSVTYPWRHPLALFMLTSHKFLRLLLPFFMIGAFVFNLLGVITAPDNALLWLAFIGQCFVYGLALYGYWLDKRGKKQKIPRLFYYIVSSNGATLRGFVQFARGKESVLWERVQRA